MRALVDRAVRARSDPYLADHGLLLDGDHAARERLAAALLRDLMPAVRRIVRQEARGFVEPAVDDAILDYLRSPARFNPDRGCLVNYLTTAAYRNVLNLKRAETRRRLAEGRAAYWFRPEPCWSVFTVGDLLDEVLSACCDSRERSFVLAWLDGANAAELASFVSPPKTADTDARDVVRAQVERLRLRFKRYLRRLPAGRREIVSAPVEKALRAGNID